MKIISERHKVYRESWELGFLLIENNEICFSFPCDETGCVTILNPCAMENYEYCVKNSDKYYSQKRLYKSSWMEPAIGICKCGKEVPLVDEYCGACQCECGQWYNMCGQPLNPPNLWEEDIDYEY